MNKLIMMAAISMTLMVVMINDHLRSAEARRPQVTTSTAAPLHPCEQVLTTNVMTWSCKQLMIQRWCVDGAPCLIHMGAAI